LFEFDVEEIPERFVASDVSPSKLGERGVPVSLAAYDLNFFYSF